MKVQKLEQELLSDNLANINTTGYKRARNVYKSFNEHIAGLAETNKGVLNRGSVIHSTDYNLSQGPLNSTGNALDIAITGDGMFALDTGDGQVAFTRDGHFTLSSEGYVTNDQGDILLDEGLSPVYIDINSARNIVIGNNGNLTVDDMPLTKLGTFQVPKRQNLIKIDGNKYITADISSVVPAAGDTFHQGFLEASNVSAVTSSTDMIQVMRNYESNQKALNMQAETLQMITNAGRI
jgi:flagellar basal body rod protein FlgG